MSQSSREQQLLEQHLLGISREDYLRDQPKLNPTQQQQLKQLLARRANGEPIAKIIGKKAFWNCEFFTTQHTLDPRPESELIIEAVIALRPNKNAPLKLLDLGTGTGCLLLSLLKEYPNANGLGVDISAKAIEVAQQNAIEIFKNQPNRANFNNLSWTELEKSLYDVIITNPPYIPTADINDLDADVKHYDPMSALDGGQNGLDAYNQIFCFVGDLLNDDGLFICEIGINQQDDVINLAEKSGFQLLNAYKDLSGIMRTLAFTK